MRELRVCVVMDEDSLSMMKDGRGEKKRSMEDLGDPVNGKVGDIFNVDDVFDVTPDEHTTVLVLQNTVIHSVEAVETRNEFPLNLLHNLDIRISFIPSEKSLCDTMVLGSVNPDYLSDNPPHIPSLETSQRTLAQYESIFGSDRHDIKIDLQHHKIHQRWHLSDTIKGPIETENN